MSPELEIDVLFSISMPFLFSSGHLQNNHVPGVFPPEHLIDERQKVPKDTQIDKGMEIARRMICQLERDAICDGVPIVAIGKEEPVASVLTTPGIAWSQRYPTALLFDS